jgi:hypothetical protein
MRPPFNIAVCALALVFAGSLRAQALWPGTNAGMRLEEVQKLFPTAHAPENAEPLPGNSVVQLLELDHVVIAEHTFQVKFFFNSERLVKVSLTEVGEVLAKDFEKIRELLRAKYGHEDSTTSSESIQLNWKAVQTTLQLKWTPARRDAAVLILTYESPIPKETDRL